MYRTDSKLDHRKAGQLSTMLCPVELEARNRLVSVYVIGHVTTDRPSRSSCSDLIHHH